MTKESKLSAEQRLQVRESRLHYIGPDQNDIDQMLQALGLNSLEDLYSHIQPDVKFGHNNKKFTAPERLEAPQIESFFKEIADKNLNATSFAQDNLFAFKPNDLVGDICGIRGLTTAYTPYQPERSQGTLMSLWIYQSCLSALTGFEAVNASLYERSTALYEALAMGVRQNQRSGKNIVLVSDSLYESDLKVVKTMTEATGIEIQIIKSNPDSKLIEPHTLESLGESTLTKVAAFAFPHFNRFGLAEDVDSLTKWSEQNKVLSIGVIEPILLADGNLKKPTQWGEYGVDVIVGEAQNLCLDANFGGPGLGIFGVRYNEKNKALIRQTPGRFVGAAKDLENKDCKVIVLSTREQHIRREKATSNICSNQSFLASLAGANLLNWGTSGLRQKIEQAKSKAQSIGQTLSQLPGVEWKNQSNGHIEVLLKLDDKATEYLQKALTKAKSSNFVLGKFVDSNFFKITVTDKQTNTDVENLVGAISAEFNQILTIHPVDYKAKGTESEIASHEPQAVIDFYKQLGDLNTAPDEGIYPLGSCTMKYNPMINDKMAGLSGFTESHPEEDESNSQGSLEVLYRCQEAFKEITGLPGLTTQPVAGAQGELVGLKLFQAYHKDRGEGQKRKYIIIPRSAHGTNPATAVTAGFSATLSEQNGGIILLNATPDGLMDMGQLKEILKEKGSEVAGVMVTNPNTSGLFEVNFKEMADLIHQAGGLVYMDGANMNAVAGITDLEALGVDAVHNNLHKTWSIPHGGGGPGDGIVAVSDKLINFLPGYQIKEENGVYTRYQTPKTIGSFHRHYGNFAHKVRALTYLKALGPEGIQRMSSVAVLSARYLFEKLRNQFPTLPFEGEQPRMHEFIISLKPELIKTVEELGIPRGAIIGRVGKLFLDFGFHAPTVSFPEPMGLMIEPTESFTKEELDEFAETVIELGQFIEEHPEVLLTAPHLTPIKRVDEASANRNLIFNETNLSSSIGRSENDALFSKFPELPTEEIKFLEIRHLTMEERKKRILGKHQELLEKI